MATEPKNLTKTAISKLSRDDLVVWATGRALLEHLDSAEINDKTKGDLVNEVMGALLRVEVAEDHHAAATDTVARPVDELIGGETSVKADPESTKQINEGRAKLATKAAKRTTRKVRTTPTREAKRTLEQMTEDYAKLTDAQRAKVWQAGRSEGESVKTIRQTRTGHGPSAALREWHRLTDAGLLDDPIGKRGRPSNGATTKASAPAKAPAKKATATRKATPAKKATAKKVVSATKRAAVKKTAEQPQAETA